jgi:predicted permease
MKRDLFATAREFLMRLVGTVRPGRTEADLQHELQHHLALAEEDLRRRGHSAQEARRLARAQAGKETQAMETIREQNRVPPISTFYLDAKLGLRMLQKHWGLTLVGGLAMAVAIGAGAAAFDVLSTLGGTRLPLENGAEVVVVQPWDPATRKEHYSSPDDFARWRADLQSVKDVAAFTTTERNLITEDGQSAPVAVAEMSGAGFRVARVEPLLGRFLIEEDEHMNATPVVVIGYNVWRSRFRSDPDVAGRRLQLGEDFFTVTGVMPENFRFPVTHDVWIPLRLTSASAQRPVEDPIWGNSAGNFALTVFGRLAQGTSLDRAQAEVVAKGLVGGETSEPGRSLEARVVPYATGITGNTDAWLQRILYYLLALLLIPPCANIAVLIYARIVARQQEFAARLVLGASRGRIVSQVFTEVLVLAGLAAGVGLLLARQAVAAFQAGQEQRLGRALPFWMDFSFSPSTIFYAFGLALVAALIAGGLPAIRATGCWSRTGLHALSHRTSLRLGKVWTGVVVLQVALSVATLPTVLEAAWWTVNSSLPGPGFDPAEYLTARLVMDGDPAMRLAGIPGDLIRQLEANANVSGVSMSQALPGSEPTVLIERIGGSFSGGHVREYVSFNAVDQKFFNTYTMSLLAGRRFEPGDLDPGASAVVVNRSFAKNLSAGETALGVQLRRVTRADDRAQATAWRIVGIVDDSFDGRNTMTMYRPLPPVPDERVLSLSLRAAPSGAGMSQLTGRLREIGAQLDPSMRIIQPRTLGAIYEDRKSEDYLNSSVMVGVVLGVVLFSAAGIYTILSFTVVQRRQEVGIRAALGASPLRLVAGIFRRALFPVATGVLVGGLAALGIHYYLSDILFESIKQDHRGWILPASEAFILAIGLLAIAGPARRAMKVDPAEALRNG